MTSIHASGRRQAASFKSLAVAADALGVSIYATACVKQRRAGVRANARHQTGAHWSIAKKSSISPEFRWR